MPDRFTVGKPSTSDTLWFVFTLGGVLGGLFLWAALDDPWWLAAAELALCLPSVDTERWEP